MCLRHAVCKNFNSHDKKASHASYLRFIWFCLLELFCCYSNRTEEEHGETGEPVFCLAKLEAERLRTVWYAAVLTKFNVAHASVANTTGPAACTH